MIGCIWNTIGVERWKNSRGWTISRCENVIGLEGQFDGWTREAGDAKLSRLIDVIDRYKSSLYEVSSMVEWDDYHSIIGEGEFRKEFYNPYSGLLTGCFRSSLVP